MLPLLVVAPRVRGRSYLYAGNSLVILDGLFFFQAEDGIRDLVRSRGLGDVYKRQVKVNDIVVEIETAKSLVELPIPWAGTVAALLAPELSLIHI